VEFAIGFLDDVVHDQMVYPELIIVEILDDPLRLFNAQGFRDRHDHKLSLLMVSDEGDHFFRQSFPPADDFEQRSLLFLNLTVSFNFSKVLYKFM
jgi:hypothetical protein